MFVKSSALFLVACALFAVATANSVNTDSEECPSVCPALYEPLCATNGKIVKEFDNACQLKVSNCRLLRSAQQKYVTTDKDFCNTELVADLDHLLEKLGNLDLSLPECLKPCAMIYSPVCMSNGKYRAIASNECIMDTFNCVLNKKGLESFRVLQPGSC
ncbi:hypothetical protein DOY81_005028 [Sarcophaga bullata]|nr:hypothetical protein DOY81_005028 [Sarcophaga bullata]